jgi:hypothetical protein
MAMFGAGGLMFAYGWSPQVMAIGAVILGIGVVCLAALAWYCAIANFGPLSLVPKEGPKDREAKE